MSAARKHKWRVASREFDRTVRICERGCGTRRITRHDGDRFPWVEWEIGGFVYQLDKVPACIPARGGVS